VFALRRLEKDVLSFQYTGLANAQATNPLLKSLFHFLCTGEWRLRDNVVMKYFCRYNSEPLASSSTSAASHEVACGVLVVLETNIQE
jgi:hypothetical protein